MHRRITFLLLLVQYFCKYIYFHFFSSEFCNLRFYFPFPTYCRLWKYLICMFKGPLFPKKYFSKISQCVWWTCWESNQLHCTKQLKGTLSFTVGNKIIRALAIILAISLSFDWQFLSSHVYYKQYKAIMTLQILIS